MRGNKYDYKIKYDDIDILLADIRVLFFSDGEFNVLEQNMMRFLEKLLKN